VNHSLSQTTNNGSKPPNDKLLFHQRSQPALVGLTHDSGLIPWVAGRLLAAGEGYALPEGEAHPQGSRTFTRGGSTESPSVGILSQ
jgi:hypothetical protein